MWGGGNTVFAVCFLLSYPSYIIMHFVLLTTFDNKEKIYFVPQKSFAILYLLDGKDNGLDTVSTMTEVKLGIMWCNWRKNVKRGTSMIDEKTSECLVNGRS